MNDIKDIWNKKDIEIKLALFMVGLFIIYLFIILCVTAFGNDIIVKVYNDTVKEKDIITESGIFEQIDFIIAFESGYIHNVTASTYYALNVGSTYKIQVIYKFWLGIRQPLPKYKYIKLKEGE